MREIAQFHRDQHGYREAVGVAHRSSSEAVNFVVPQGSRYLVLQDENCPFFGFAFGEAPRGAVLAVFDDEEFELHP